MLTTSAERLYTFHMLDVYRQNALRLSNYDMQRDRYVIFSDAHIGDRRPTLDEFQPNEATFCAALRYYLQEDYGLILNGDMEEGWKNRYADVLGAYADSIYALEGEFARQGEKRHLRIWGNHDDDWQRPAMVDKHLGGALKKRVRVHPAVILGDRILIAHGHQGDPNADYMARVSRLAVRYVWRHIQAIFNLERHVCGDPNVAWQRREHHLYEWAKARQMLLIAGHTHRPMFHHFSPTPYLHLLRDSLTQHLDAVWHDPLWRRLISAALACWDRLWERLEKEVALPLMPPAAPPLTPCYLNAGSCLSSGGITGIEIDRGEVRLIQWSGHGLAPQRNVYQQADLGAMLALI